MRSNCNKMLRLILALMAVFFVSTQSKGQTGRLLLNTLETIDQIEKVYQNYAINDCNYLNINANGFFVEKDTCSGFELSFSVTELDPKATKLFQATQGEGSNIAFYCLKNASCIKVVDEKGGSRYYTSFEAFNIRETDVETQQKLLDDFTKLHKYLANPSKH